MPLILNDLTPMHWAAAGAGIAAITLLLLLLGSHRLGVSTGFEDVCSLVLRVPYFQRGAITSARGWRLPLVGGLVLGGFLSAALGGGWAPMWDLGIFDERISTEPLVKLAWMFAGGPCIGIGTRMGGGCTSGHGIFGLSNLELPSLITTIAFMGGGVIATNAVFRLLFP
jgi:uncharacterized protein